jgi:hypothetical protein
MTKFDDWPLWLQLLVGVPHPLPRGFFFGLGRHYVSEAFIGLREGSPVLVLSSFRAMNSRAGRDHSG